MPIGSKISVFDPVLCELMYRWFCPPGGRVFDPFAGGSVRGIVAAAHGLRYMGFEIRPEQVEANLENWEQVLPKLAANADLKSEPAPKWAERDSRTMNRHRAIYDLILTCPRTSILNATAICPMIFPRCAMRSF